MQLAAKQERKNLKMIKKVNKSREKGQRMVNGNKVMTITRFATVSGMSREAARVRIQKARAVYPDHVYKIKGDKPLYFDAVIFQFVASDIITGRKTRKNNILSQKKYERFLARYVSIGQDNQKSRKEMAKQICCLQEQLAAVTKECSTLKEDLKEKSLECNAVKEKYTALLEKHLVCIEESAAEQNETMLTDNIVAIG